MPPAELVARASRWPAWPLLFAVTGLSATTWAVLYTVFPADDQNFPLGDDWAFVRGLSLCLSGEGAHYLNWASMPEFGQWLWAWPWVRWVGPAMANLRASTIVCSWLGLAAFFDLLRRDGVPAPRAAFAAACLAFCPLFFLLAGTFMTDVPALSFCLVSLALLVRALRSRGLGPLLASALVSLLAVTTRQNAAGLPLTAAVLLWRGPRQWWAAWALAVAVPLAVAAPLYVWFQGRPDILPVTPAVKPAFAYLVTPLLLLQYAGLAVLPALALRPRPSSWLAFGLVLAMTVAAAAFWGASLQAVPSWQQSDLIRPSFDPVPLFPYTMPMVGPNGPFAGQFVLGFGPDYLGWWARLVLTGVGCVTAAGLVARLEKRGMKENPRGAVSVIAGAREDRAGDSLTPLAVFTLIQFLFILAAPKVYDRYVLFLIPGALAVAVRPAPAGRRAWAGGLVVLLVSAVVSVGLMHDWLAWNRARWTLGRKAVAEGVHPWQIEGGFEWDGWFGPGPDRPEEPAAVTAEKMPVRLPSGYDFRFWHVNARYGLAFNIPKGSHSIAEEPYSLWLLPRRREFHLVRYED